MRGKRITAISMSLRSVDFSKRSVRLSSSSISTWVYGITPATGTLHRSSSVFRPGSSIARSPRNLLTIVPLMRSLSSFSNSATVPYNWANTPPRSISPTRRTGASTNLARPMFTMSSCFRLISAGLPAPSITIMSYSDARLL